MALTFINNTVKLNYQQQPYEGEYLLRIIFNSYFVVVALAASIIIIIQMIYIITNEDEKNDNDDDCELCNHDYDRLVQHEEKRRKN